MPLLGFFSTEHILRINLHPPPDKRDTILYYIWFRDHKEEGQVAYLCVLLFEHKHVTHTTIPSGGLTPDVDFSCYSLNLQPVPKRTEGPSIQNRAGKLSILFCACTELHHMCLHMIAWKYTIVSDKQPVLFARTSTYFDDGFFAFILLLSGSTVRKQDCQYIQNLTIHLVTMAEKKCLRW